MPTFPGLSLCATVMVFGGSLGLAAELSNQSTLLEERFRQLDRNHDGRLTREEAGDARWFDRIDRDGDGVITRDEIRLVLEALQRAQGPESTLSAEPAGVTEAREIPAERSVRSGPKILKGSAVGVGRLVPDVAFTDHRGQSGRLSDYAKSQALVIAFTGTSCPLAKKYAPSLARLEKEFMGRGVAFLFVNPTATDSVADIESAIRENDLRGRYVRTNADPLVAVLGATTTTEVFVLDAARTLVFRGAVDDQYGLGYSLGAPRQAYLRDALMAVLGGGTPPIVATDAPGCVLDLSAADKVAGTNFPRDDGITYHNRISRIVQQNCLECHHRGGVAPFSLATYEDVRSHAGMMRKQVGRDVMPPWFAAAGSDGSSHWKNDRSLAVADKRDLLAWLAGDKPVGNPAEAPLPRVFSDGWAIGRPDAVLQLPRDVAIKSDGVMPYQVLQVETEFTEDKWVQAYEVQPTAREVVHHVIIKVHPKGTIVGSRAEREATAEREGFFAAYVPGNSHATFPEGFAKKIPAGATVSFQMHYTPNGAATTDRTKLGLVFAAAPPRHVIRVAGLANPRLNIPPGDDNHPETASLTLPFETTLLSLMPHMHVRGKAARYEVILPDGTRSTLLEVPRYDFNWQLPYEFADPPTFPRGTRLVYTAWYDNSAGNPANPDSTRRVRWGPQTFDEMMLGYVEYYVPGRGVAEWVQDGPLLPRPGE